MGPTAPQRDKTAYAPILSSVELERSTFPSIEHLPTKKMEGTLPQRPDGLGRAPPVCGSAEMPVRLLLSCSTQPTAGLRAAKQPSHRPRMSRGLRGVRQATDWPLRPQGPCILPLRYAALPRVPQVRTVGWPSRVRTRHTPVSGGKLGVVVSFSDGNFGRHWCSGFRPRGTRRGCLGLHQMPRRSHLTGNEGSGDRHRRHMPAAWSLVRVRREWFALKIVFTARTPK